MACSNGIAFPEQLNQLNHVPLGPIDEKGQPIIGYDTLDRLVSFTVSAGVRTTRTEYGYEGYNRKTENVANIVPVKTIVDGREVITYEKAVLNDKVYSYDSLNRLTGVVDRIPNTTVAYAYDANGNTIQKTDSNFTAAYADTFFEYDSLNRLVQSKRGTLQGGNLLGLYDYDANNMRIRHRNSDRGDVDYYYDGNSVIEERNSADDSLLARYSYADRLLALATASGSQYYHQDALGSTVNLTDGTGAVQAGYVLDPWGHVIRQQGESVNRQIFTGQEQDTNTGLVYFGQRYYDPDTGRFINQDSYLGKQDTPPSLHRYLYAYSNPTVYIDLHGYDSVSVNKKDNSVYWTVESDPLFSDTKERKVKIGTISKGKVQLTQEFGGGLIAHEQLKKAASNFWLRNDTDSIMNHADISGYKPEYQNQLISAYIDDVLNPHQETRIKSENKQTKTPAAVIGDAFGAVGEYTYAKLTGDERRAEDAEKHLAENKDEYIDTLHTLGSLVVGGVKVTKNGSRLATSKSKPYTNPKSRPPYGDGQVEKTYENAKQPDGKVYDPNTGEELPWNGTKPRNGQWDMGHTQENKYSEWHQKYLKDEITKKEFLDWYRNPNNYRPESPSANRGHKYE